MRNIDNDALYQLFKVAGSILVTAVFQTMFLSAKHIKDSTRRNALIICAFVTALNVWGILRNIYTIHHFGTFWDYLWEAGNWEQTIWTAYLFTIVYNRIELNKKWCIVMLLHCLIWLPYNFYSLMINFGYFDEEGLLVFCMWFVKNGGMMLFSAAVAFVLFFMEQLPKWKNPSSLK